MTNILYTIAAMIDAFNSPILATGLLTAGTGLIFLASRGHAVALLLSSLLALGMSYMLKILFAVPRLDSALVPVTGYRFPSQHALIASTFFSSLCFSAFCLVDSPYIKILIAALSLITIVVIAWSRVFLHAHLPIDVIVGSILGVSISLVIHFMLLRKCYAM